MNQQQTDITAGAVPPAVFPAAEDAAPQQAMPGKSRAVKTPAAKSNRESIAELEAGTIRLMATNYSYGSRAEPMVKQLIDRLIADPHAERKEIAAELGITRQTLYNWLHRIKANKPVRGRGRRRKYGDQSSVPLSIRIPVTLASKLGGTDDGNDMRLVREKVEEMVVDIAVAKQMIERPTD